jgi:glycosyltransferase involved in cell wall biosynthesis
MKLQKPTISVVIPCRNERERIAQCLHSVLEQEDVPGGFEVIIADGMSDDGTREALDGLCRIDKRLIVIDNRDRITACGMNAGIRKARGEYVAIMGAHNHYAHDYLRSCLEVARETGADNVGGSMFCVGTSWLQQAIAIAHHSRFSVGGARWHDVEYEGPADTVFGGFYRREVFDRLGLLDETLVRNQDDEFNLRLTRAAGRIWHSPRIRSWYYPRASLAAVFRQYLQYGYWKVAVIQKHRIPASVRHLVPGSFVGALIALPFFGLAWSPALKVWLAMTGGYLFCTATASMMTAAKAGWRYLPVLPLVFGCYHFGYGIGFIKGITDFLILHRVPSDRFRALTRSSSRSLRGA